jgi:hypothetical protein
MLIFLLILAIIILALNIWDIFHMNMDEPNGLGQILFFLGIVSFAYIIWFVFFH